MQENREWISMSDLMSGLMLVFLFIVVAFMLKVDAEKKEVEEIAQTYKIAKVDLNKDLEKEFNNDLKKWGAEILPDNTIRFKNTLLLFEPGSSTIKDPFKRVLDDFFPRYVGVLEGYHDDIKELRIEGHTSSAWARSATLEERYLGNAALSQARSLAVLAYCFQTHSVNNSKPWLTKTLRANGLAFANPVLDTYGNEDPIASRRVEFKAILKTEEKIQEILNRIETKDKKTKQTTG